LFPFSLAGIHFSPEIQASEGVQYNEQQFTILAQLSFRLETGQ
jgi:hypothetical protein